MLKSAEPTPDQIKWINARAAEPNASSDEETHLLNRLSASREALKRALSAGFLDRSEADNLAQEPNVNQIIEAALSLEDQWGKLVRLRESGLFEAAEIEAVRKAPLEQKDSLLKPLMDRYYLAKVQAALRAKYIDQNAFYRYLNGTDESRRDMQFNIRHDLFESMAKDVQSHLVTSIVSRAVSADEANAYLQTSSDIHQQLDRARDINLLSKGLQRLEERGIDVSNIKKEPDIAARCKMAKDATKQDDDNVALMEELRLFCTMEEKEDFNSAHSIGERSAKVRVLWGKYESEALPRRALLEKRNPYVI